MTTWKTVLKSGGDTSFRFQPSTGVRTIPSHPHVDPYGHTPKWYLLPMSYSSSLHVKTAFFYQNILPSMAGWHDLISAHPVFENLWDTPQFKILQKRVRDEQASERVELTRC